MNIKANQSLNTMIRRAPLNEETVSKFRDQALQTIDQAIDVFFKPEREVAEGKQAYDKLSDLQGALRSYQGRFASESASTTEKFNAIEGKNTLEPFEGDVGQTASLLPDGKPLKNGYREVEYARMKTGHQYTVDGDQHDIAKLVGEMGDVLPLFGSVAMVPGPLSVSLKDHIKESLQWSLKSDSRSRTNANEETFRLLTLGASKKTVSGRSYSASESSGQRETQTVDERVMPGLHAIRSGVSQLGYAPPEETDYTFTQRVKEFEKVTKTTGRWFWKKDVTSFERANSGTLTEEGEAVYIPGRMNMEAEIGNAGLTNPGAGSELVDLVAKADLNQDFVDEFRESSLAVLDGATETLFNTKREVSEGRERYDQLSNLQRALELANERFGETSYYDEGALEQEIAKLNAVTPLYACVAMVPGEMSSSVKNHAKDLFEANYSARSGSSEVSRELKGSLFGSISEATSSSSSRSSTTGYVRKESITTDERIMPTLHDLRIQLGQLTLGEDRDGDTILTIHNPQELDD